MNIKVHIERLILDGLPLDARQGALVKAAVETELARLLAAGGNAATPQEGGAMPKVHADPILLAAHSDPAQIGRQIANGVHSAIGKAR